MAITFESQTAAKTIGQFLLDAVERSGLRGFVVGLSGGIDSALATALAVQAVGPKAVLGIMMPYKSSSQSSIEDAAKVADSLGIECQTVDISPMIDAYYPKIDRSLRLRAGNKMARERMSILFDYAYSLNRLVLGTGNRTEICLGYTTLFGDSACSVNPIGELYKSEVRQLSAYLALPEAVLTKAPSADLWVGQTDEEEIGVSYEEIDRLLRRLVDDQIRSRSQLTGEGFSPDSIDRVLAMLNRNSFKRNLPPVAHLDRSGIPDRIELQE